METLRSARSTELRYVRLTPLSWASASWLRPRAARNLRMFRASTSRSGPLCVRFTTDVIMPIDGFKATAFKIQSLGKSSSHGSGFDDLPLAQAAARDGGPDLGRGGYHDRAVRGRRLLRSARPRLCRAP